MSENRHTKEFLKEMQALPLERKISLTAARITEWYLHFDGKVYISFSGGKDSTVLLDIARKLFPDIEAVFCDTGLEYPEIREFVKTFDNVTWLRPKMNFKQVVEKCGYPVISKETSKMICEYRQNPNGRDAQKFNPESEYIKRFGKRYDLSKWIYLRDSEIKISDKCCNEMKKKPFKTYEKQSNKKAILGTMTEESNLRQTEWQKHIRSNMTSA